MYAAALLQVTPREIYDALMAERGGEKVEPYLARMLATWSLGYGAMPEWLGLDEAGFRQMMAHHFPGYDLEQIIHSGTPPDPRRLDEAEDLCKMLIKHRSGHSESEIQVAQIVTAGCMGEDHLWQDLGLWSRDDLTQMLLLNFESLAKRNDRNMKWKKFLYKQLCESEGLYICRAPSCDVCVDFSECFGPE